MNIAAISQRLFQWSKYKMCVKGKRYMLKCYLYDFYNFSLGTIKTYQLSKVGKYGTYFKLEPVLTVMKCFKTEGTKTDNVLPQSVLPDMTGFLVSS